MPDDVAEEKIKALLALGAHVEHVRPASIVDKKQVRGRPSFRKLSLILMTTSATVCSEHAVFFTSHRVLILPLEPRPRARQELWLCRG